MSSVNKIQELNYKGKPVYVYELTHSSGAKAVISNYGCILMKLQVQDKTGSFRDVVLGFDTIESYWEPSYLKSYPYFGAIIGRYSNRIKKASFFLNEKQINVSTNQGENCLHGGYEGFDKKVWDVIEIRNEKDPCISFKYYSADAEEGFPGNLTTTFTIKLGANFLEYTIEANTDADTAVNLTYHPYFNLDPASASINTQKAIIHANNWLEQDEDFCTTGKLIPTVNSEYDFLKWKTIIQEWNKTDGYDQSFVANKSTEEMDLVAEALSSDANLHLQVISTEPIVHFYTGKWIPEISGKNNIVYGAYSGFCFETQHHPNAVNVPSFPNTIFTPNQTYKQTTIYQFI